MVVDIAAIYERVDPRVSLSYCSIVAYQRALVIRVCTQIIHLKSKPNVIYRYRRWIMRFDLSDDEWALFEPLMPKSRKSARADDRKIMNAIFYVLRTGMPWRDLPRL